MTKQELTGTEHWSLVDEMRLDQQRPHVEHELANVHVQVRRQASSLELKQQNHRSRADLARRVVVWSNACNGTCFQRRGVGLARRVAVGAVIKVDVEVPASTSRRIVCERRPARNSGSSCCLGGSRCAAAGGDAHRAADVARFPYVLERNNVGVLAAVKICEQLLNLDEN
jgi:hypothetical protein